MKFVNKGFNKKIIIVLMIIILFNAVMPTGVYAANWFESVILKPFFSFLVSIVGTLDACVGYVLMLGNGSNAVPSIEAVIGDLWNGGGLDVASPYLIGVDSIFAGDITILDADMFEANGGELREKVRAAVASGYVTLRNIGAVIMLIGLVYTGIQILLNSNIPTKKTQYLMLLQDWVIGMCILLLSHVIMTIVFGVSDLFVDGFRDAITPTTGASTMNGVLLEKMLNCDASFTGIMSVCPYLILLGFLIYQCCYFGLAYFRRLLYVCVLILFAPIFSVMYAFGQQTKQIYSKWLREFITAVFIQPFHIIVYYVMIILPLGNVNGKTDLFTMVYVTICVFMLRPVEAYLKNLVGLNTGIAGSTSYEGGRAIKDAAVKSFTELNGTDRAYREAKENGASAFQLMKIGLFGANAKGPEGESWEQEYKKQELDGRDEELGIRNLPQGTEDVDEMNEEQLASMMGQQMDDLQDKSNEEGTSLNAANITIGSANIDMPELGGIGQFALQEQTEQLKEGENETAELSSELMQDTKKLLDDPSLGLTDEQKEEYMADPQKLANDLPGMKRNLTREIKKGDVGKLISNIDGAIGQRMEDGVTPEENEYGGDPHTDKRQRVRDLLSGSIKGKDNKKEFDFVTSHADGSELTALEERGEMLSRRKLMDKVSGGLKDSGYSAPAIGGNKELDYDAGGSNGPRGAGASGSANGQGTGNISAGNITINASSINLQGGTNIGGNNIAGNASGKQITSGGESTTKAIENTKNQSTIAGDESYEIGGRKLNRRDKKEIMEDAGVDTAKARRRNSLYAAAHTLQDALYITPPPGDWKGTYDARQARIATKEKEREALHTREKESWANNKANISIVADKYMGDMRERYSDKPEAYIRMKAEEKAKSALKDMSAYVPYGITDVDLAYKLYDEANKHAFTPEEAIRNMAGYNKFNSNASNVVSVNKMEIEGAGSFKTVSQALPNAQYYYGSGYTKVEEIAAMEDLAKRLQTSPEFTMKIHEALKRKGGNINYEGLDPKVKTTIEDINKNYKKLLKNSGIK